MTLSASDWQKVCTAFGFTTEEVIELLNHLNNPAPILLEMDKGTNVSSMDSKNFSGKSNPDRNKIIQIFNYNVKGKSCPTSKSIFNGSEGHWLEKKMGVVPNSDNKPDLLGYEMKTQSPATTFIDKQTDAKFYEGKRWTSRQRDIKEKWWKLFERTNSKPNKVGGWKIEKWDCDGQCLKVTGDNSICVIYNYSKDGRADKEQRMTSHYKDNADHIIAKWEGSSLKKCIENKFNQKGFFICKKNREGIYEKICFGECIRFNYWINQFKKGEIYYDGYSSLNGRWRGTFRASSRWWNKHITEEY